MKKINIIPYVIALAIFAAIAAALLVLMPYVNAILFNPSI